MRGPITWRNVDSPDFSRGNLISSGVADIQSGLEGLQNILGTQARQQQQTWQQGKEANTINALNQINQLRSVDALNNTQAGDLINPYGAQVNAQAVMDALKGQRGVIAKDMQTEDAINGYTEKVKYGPIADQAALLIQQGRVQEAAPLLEQLKGTSYAKELGGMVQQLDWHNQDQRLKQRELALQADRIKAENRRYTEAQAEDNMFNTAAAYMGDLVNNKGMLPDDAKVQTLKVFGQKPGVNIVKMSQALDSYSSGAFQLSTGDKIAIQDLKTLKDSVLATGESRYKAQLEGAAQKVGYDPVMQEQLDKWALKPNASIIGDGDGQIPKPKVDALNKTLASQNLSPLSAGEIAWLAQNPDKGILNDEYKLNNIIQQRKAKGSYMEMTSGLQKEYNDWATETNNGFNDKIVLATRYALSPTSYPEAGNTVEEEKTVLNNRVAALDAAIGKITGAPEREQQKEAELNKLKQQRDAAVAQLGQLATANAGAKQNVAGQPYSYAPVDSGNWGNTPEAKTLQANVAKRQWVSNYMPKTPKEWDMAQQAIAKRIQQDGLYPTMRLRILNEAVARAKNGDSSDFRRYFSNGLEKYAETLYHSQKAGKK